MSNQQETPDGISHHGNTPHDFGPPAPPKLMTLTSFVNGELVDVYEDVVASSLASPTILRLELLDKRIVLIDMTGRDFIFTPQET